MPWKMRKFDTHPKMSRDDAEILAAVLIGLIIISIFLVWATHC